MGRQNYGGVDKPVLRVVTGDNKSHSVAYACRKRRLKWVPSAWGYSWVNLSPGVTNTKA
jgi:hypothetical protein